MLLVIYSALYILIYLTVCLNSIWIHGSLDTKSKTYTEILGMLMLVMWIVLHIYNKLFPDPPTLDWIILYTGIHCISEWCWSVSVLYISQLEIKHWNNDIVTVIYLYTSAFLFLGEIVMVYVRRTSRKWKRDTREIYL
jgi:hypothetical protein